MTMSFAFAFLHIVKSALIMKNALETYYTKARN